jgi:mRNA (2'-O-methyladenosine-N6-)-methyltransferase
VVLVDPPWRLRSAQRSDEQSTTLSNQEIMNISVENLSTKGFCFLWVVNSQVDIGYDIMNKWGYQVID